MPYLGIAAVGAAWLAAQTVIAGGILVATAPWLPPLLSTRVDAMRSAALLRRVRPLVDTHGHERVGAGEAAVRWLGLGGRRVRPGRTGRGRGHGRVAQGERQPAGAGAAPPPDRGPPSAARRRPADRMAPGAAADRGRGRRLRLVLRAGVATPGLRGAGRAARPATAAGLPVQRRRDDLRDAPVHGAAGAGRRARAAPVGARPDRRRAGRAAAGAAGRGGGARQRAGRAGARRARRHRVDATATTPRTTSSPTTTAGWWPSSTGATAGRTGSPCSTW